MMPMNSEEKATTNNSSRMSFASFVKKDTLSTASETSSFSSQSSPGPTSSKEHISWPTAKEEVYMEPFLDKQVPFILTPQAKSLTKVMDKINMPRSAPVKHRRCLSGDDMKRFDFKSFDKQNSSSRTGANETIFMNTKRTTTSSSFMSSKQYTISPLSSFSSDYGDENRDEFYSSFSNDRLVDSFVDDRNRVPYSVRKDQANQKIRQCNQYYSSGTLHEEPDTTEYNVPAKAYSPGERKTAERGDDFATRSSEVIDRRENMKRTSFSKDTQYSFEGRAVSTRDEKIKSFPQTPRSSRNFTMEWNANEIIFGSDKKDCNEKFGTKFTVDQLPENKHPRQIRKLPIKVQVEGTNPSPSVLLKTPKSKWLKDQIDKNLIPIEIVKCRKTPSSGKILTPLGSTQSDYGSTAPTPRTSGCRSKGSNTTPRPTKFFAEDDDNLKENSERTMHANERRLKELRLENTLLKEELDSEIQMRGNLEKDNEWLEESFRIVDTDLHKCQRQIKHMLSEEISDWFQNEGEIAKLLAALETAKKREKDLIEDRDSTRLKDTQVASVLKDQFKTIIQERDQLQTEKNKATANVSHLEQEIDELQTAASQARDEKRQLQAKLDNFKSRITRLEENNDLLSAENELIEEKVSLMQTLIKPQMPTPTACISGTFLSEDPSICSLD